MHGVPQGDGLGPVSPIHSPILHHDILPPIMGSCGSGIGLLKLMAQWPFHGTMTLDHLRVVHKFLYFLYTLQKEKKLAELAYF